MMPKSFAGNTDYILETLFTWPSHSICKCHYLETFDKDLLKLDQKVPSTALRISRPGSLGQQSLW